MYSRQYVPSLCRSSSERRCNSSWNSFVLLGLLIGIVFVVCPTVFISKIFVIDLQKTTSWNIPHLLRDSFSMIGSAVGGISSAFYGFNFVMPIVQKRIKRPMWLHFLIGAPPVVVFSSACAGFMGGAIPAVAQLGITSYHAASSSPTQDDQLPKTRTSSSTTL